MPQINIKVKDKIAETESDVAYVCGNSDFVIVFDFDDEWTEYEVKTARFKYNGTYQDIIFHGNHLNVPVIENTYKIYIGVYAGDLHTTTPAVLNAKKSILSGSGTPIIEKDDVYSQLMQELNDQIGLAEDSEKAAAQSAKEAAESAREADAAKQEVYVELDTKVDKVTGKGLSTNDYTTDEKNKLAGVEAGANKTVVDSALSDTSENPVQNKAVKSAIDDKADKTSVNELKSDKLDKPATPPSKAGKVLRVLAVNEDGTFTCEWAEDSSGVTDVKIVGNSIVTDSVANVPFASVSDAGVVIVKGDGVHVTSEGVLRVSRAVDSQIDARSSVYNAIVPRNIDHAVKMAMCDGKGGAWTEDEQAAARDRMGASGRLRLISSSEITESTNSVFIQSDANGNAIDLIKAVIIGVSPISTNGDATNAYMNVRGDGFDVYTGMFGAINIKSNASDTCWVCSIVANKDVPAYAEICNAVKPAIATAMNKQVSFGNAVHYIPNITSIGIFSNGTIEAGTKIYVLGVDRA